MVVQISKATDAVRLLASGSAQLRPALNGTGVLRDLKGIGVSCPDRPRCCVDPRLLAWLHEPQLVQKDERELESYSLQVCSSLWFTDSPGEDPVRRSSETGPSGGGVPVDLSGTPSGNIGLFRRLMSCQE